MLRSFPDRREQPKVRGVSIHPWMPCHQGTKSPKHVGRPQHLYRCSGAEIGNPHRTVPSGADGRQPPIRYRLHTAKNAHADVGCRQILLQCQFALVAAFTCGNTREPVLKNDLVFEARRQIPVVGVQKKIEPTLVNGVKRLVARRLRSACLRCVVRIITIYMMHWINSIAGAILGL